MKKLALLLVAAPLAFAACGGGSPTAQVKVDPVAYVKHAATRTNATSSEHMTMTGTISAAGQSIDLKGSGDYLNHPAKGTFGFSMSGMGQSLAYTMVQDGTAIYVSSPALDSRLPVGKKWIKVDLQKLGNAAGFNFSSLMSRTPAQALQQLEAAGSVKTIGTETVDGVDTTHYQVTNLDVSKLPQGAKLQALAHPKYGPIDVWIGNKDGYIYRETASIDYSAAGQTSSISTEINLSNFGEKVNVSVPPASETVDASSMSGMSTTGGGA
jgi:hypothetical protein